MSFKLNAEMADATKDQAELLGELKKSLKSKRDWYTWLTKHCK
jgi:hypothetical protein